MSLLGTIEKDYLVAYKAKNAVTLGVLRLLKTAIKNFQVEHMRAPEDGDVFDVIIKQGKQRQDSISQFEAAGRQDLVDVESAEITVLQAFLPQTLSEAEIDTLIDSTVTQLAAHGMQDMGKVMNALRPQLQGRADMGVVSAKIKARLA